MISVGAVLLYRQDENELVFNDPAPVREPFHNVLRKARNLDGMVVVDAPGHFTMELHVECPLSGRWVFAKVARLRPVAERPPEPHQFVLCDSVSSAIALDAPKNLSPRLHPGLHVVGDARQGSDSGHVLAAPARRGQTLVAERVVAGEGRETMRIVSAS